MRIEEERIRLKGELAGLRLLTALAKLELKYRTDQARVPKGQQGGGRFASERGGGGLRGHAFVPPVAAAAARAAAATEAGVVAGAGSAAALAGVMGGAVLGLTGDSRPLAHPVPQTSRKPGDPPPEPLPRGRFEEECDKQYDEDIVDCHTQSAMYARGPKSRKQIFVICRGIAEQRRGECLRGGVSEIHTPRYLGNHHFSPEPKR